MHQLTVSYYPFSLPYIFLHSPILHFKMISNKLSLIALMGVALFAGAVDAVVLPEKRAVCLPLGSSCSVIPNVALPKCCNFLVCDRINAKCKSGITIN